MKRNLLTTALLATMTLGMGAFLAACEVGDDCDGDDCETDGGPSEGEGEGGTEGEGEGEGGTEGEGEGSEETGYLWVRICSITSSVPDARYPGPDIDAVGACDLNDDCFFATQIGEKNIAGGNNKFANANEALGQPDTNSIEVGNPEANFVSIGGSGSYLILGFDQQIMPGYDVTVYEIGTEFNPQAQNEPSRVSVGFADSNSGTWIKGTEGADTFTFKAPRNDGPVDTSCN